MRVRTGGRMGAGSAVLAAGLAGALAAVAAVAAVASVAGSAGAARSAVAPVEAPITSQQLALMPLPRPALAGQDGLKLTIDTSSGPTANARAATDSIDPADTAASLAAAGRVTGYDLSYSGGGGVQLSTGVELYRDAAAASAGLREHVAEFERLRGKEVATGARLASVATWAPRGLAADESTGLHAVVAIDTLRVRGTVVAFRVGRLVGSAGIVRDDGRDARPAAERNARALLARVRGVLAGTVRGAPVAVPAPPAASGAAASPTLPQGAPAIEPAALALADLPRGAAVEGESYTGPDGDQLVELERDFTVSGVAFGRSRLLSLINDVTLFRDAATARAFVATVTSVYRSPQVDDLLTQSLGSSEQFKGATFAVDEVQAVRLGDGGTVVASSITAKAGMFRAYFGYVRVGRVVTALVVTGAAATTREADVVALLGRAARRAGAVE